MDIDIRELREIGSAEWLQERFPEKDWHRHRRTDGRFDICDGTPSDCPSKPRLPLERAAMSADGEGTNDGR